MRRLIHRRARPESAHFFVSQHEMSAQLAGRKIGAMPDARAGMTIDNHFTRADSHHVRNKRISQQRQQP